jgi:ribose-phosphate pyrophosphokinase
MGKELRPTKKLELLAGRTHPELATEIAGHLGVELGHTNLVAFADTEIRCRFGDSVRGADVFILQTHCGIEGRSVNDSIMEQLIMIDAAKRASAKRITAVCPLYGYARQDRKAEGREPITAKLVADLLHTAGANRIVSVDLHSGQIQGFFDGPVDHLTAMPLLVDHLRAQIDGEVVIVAPDAGRVKVAERMSNHLNADLAIIHKRRPKDTIGVVEARDVVGEVDGRHCVLVDDMIATGGTMVAAAEQLKAHGALDVWAAATHGIFSGPAIDRLKNSAIDRVVVTNTLPLPSEKQIDKLEVLSIAPLIADAIAAVFEDTSVSEIFGGENQT